MIGYNYFVSEDVIWKLSNGGALPISLPRSGIYLSKIDASKLRKQMNLAFLRWEDDFDAADNSSEWWHVIKDKPDTLSSLPSKTRYMIKKASEIYVARPISFEIINEFGYEVYLDSYSRYITNESIFSKFEFKCAIKNLPNNTEWWGVFERDSGRMVGFSENFIDNNKCFFVSMWHRPDSMKLFSSYLHFFEMEQYYLVSKRFLYISDGARNINHKTNIHSFLISKFNYRKAYAKLRIVYNPFIFFLLAISIIFRPIFLRVSWLSDTKFLIALNQEWIRRRCR